MLKKNHFFIKTNKQEKNMHRIENKKPKRTKSQRIINI